MKAKTYAGKVLPCIVEGLEATCGLREFSVESLSLGPPPPGTARPAGSDLQQASGCGSIDLAGAVPSSGATRYSTTYDTHLGACLPACQTLCGTVMSQGCRIAELSRASSQAWNKFGNIHVSQPSSRALHA